MEKSNNPLNKFSAGWKLDGSGRSVFTGGSGKQAEVKAAAASTPVATGEKVISSVETTE